MPLYNESSVYCKIIEFGRRETSRKIENFDECLNNSYQMAITEIYTYIILYYIRLLIFYTLFNNVLD